MTGTDQKLPRGNDTSRIRVVKVDANGVLEWSSVYGGLKTVGEGSGSIIQTFDGGYAIVGTTSSTDGDVTLNHGDNDIWFLKL